MLSWRAAARRFQLVFSRATQMAFFSASPLMLRINVFKEPESPGHVHAAVPAAKENEHVTPIDSGSLKILMRNIKGEAERNAISVALEKTNWNRRAAARQLSISYRGLLYKIQQYHLLPPETHPSAFANSVGSKRNSHGQ